MSDTTPKRFVGTPPDQDLLRTIVAAVQEIRYGSVELVIHDSRIVQIERREKVRLTNAEP